MAVEATVYCRGVSDWKSFPEYDIMWTDPPWGVGIMKLFQRMATKAGHQPSADTLEQALVSLFRMARTDKPLFVEYGATGYDFPESIARMHGHRLLATSKCIQENGKQFVVMNFNTTFRVPDGTTGFDTIRHGLRALGPCVVFDPFAGLGKTAVTVLSMGSSYIGSEMNRDRYNKLKKAVRAWDKHKQ